MTPQELWQRNRDLADACLKHPFLQGIASGRLSRASFQLYVAQDAYFLEAFARAYALALAKSLADAGRPPAGARSASLSRRSERTLGGDAGTSKARRGGCAPCVPQSTGSGQDRACA